MGYVVYLCIALCTGELMENMIDFVGVYFPDYQAVFAAMIPVQLRARKGRYNDRRSAQGVERNTRESRASASRKTSLSLFDDLKRDGEEHGHIMGADMAMADGLAPHHPEDSLTASHKDSFVDFTMDFRKTTTDENEGGFAM